MCNLQIFIAVYVTIIVTVNCGQLFDLETEWPKFKTEFSKNYSLNEEIIRKKIFTANLVKITKHNLEADKGLHKYRLGVNYFTDLTQDEFKKSNTASLLTNSFFNSEDLRVDYTSDDIPLKVDWHAKGWVTDVRDQGLCLHGGWAYASIAAIEGQIAKKTGKLVALSDAQLIECSSSQGNHGCNGGTIEAAYDYIRSADGINTQSDYPDSPKVGPCRFKWAKAVATIQGYERAANGSETDLARAIAKVGPVATLIDALGDFRFYSSGIFSSDDCGTRPLVHGVTVVGYGSEDGVNYWLVKNSWGRRWGEAGYIRIERNADNQCGIATNPIYPILE